MGMSASQARLLYLTAQMNNLSLKGQQVSDAKTRLAMDSQEAQQAYVDALNSTNLYLNTDVYTNNGVVSQAQKLTLDNLLSQGYMISDGTNILGYKQIEVPTIRRKDSKKRRCVYAGIHCFLFEKRHAL